MKIISWNVNGINAAIGKGLLDFMEKENADIYCFQEIKVSPSKIPVIGEYESFWHPARRKGYSGVVIFSKKEPLAVMKGIENKEIDAEGRVLTLELKKFFLINVYFPHSGRDLSRIDFKLNFNKLFLEFCEKLSEKKPIIVASDFNVAHKEIDLANPKQNEKNAGFTREEREWFDSFLKNGYIDTFREFNKEGGNYTWWTYRFGARKRNIGWRVDYFIISRELKENLISSEILSEVKGSDHCPIRLEIKE